LFLGQLQQYIYSFWVWSIYNEYYVEFFLLILMIWNNTILWPFTVYHDILLTENLTLIETIRIL
jgi:hypothetical protein